MIKSTNSLITFEQPDYLEIPDWFSEKGNFKEEALSELTGMGGGYDPRAAARVVRDEAMEENIKKAAREVMEEQIKLGVDVITDGEVERGAYYMHIMRNIQGIDLENLEKKVMRSGAYSTLVPAVRYSSHKKNLYEVCLLSAFSIKVRSQSKGWTERVQGVAEGR